MPFAGAVDARLTASGVVLVSMNWLGSSDWCSLWNGDSARVGDFDMFFTGRVDELVDFTRAVFRGAAEIRVSGNFKTPDTLPGDSASYICRSSVVSAVPCPRRRRWPCRGSRPSPARAAR